MAHNRVRNAVAADGGRGRSWVLRFDGMPPGPNARLHWRLRAFAMRDWKMRTVVLVRAAEIPRLERIRISIIYYRRRLGVCDWDNDVARAKPAVDGIVAAGVVASDTRAFVTWGTVEEARGAPGVEILVEEVGEHATRDH